MPRRTRKWRRHDAVDWFLGVPPADDSYNPRLAQHLSDRRFEALGGAVFGAVGLLAGVVSIAVFLWVDSGAVGQVILSLGFLVLGAGAGAYVRARKAIAGDRDQLESLGSLFLQEPRALRSMLRGSAITEYVRQLLRTVVDNNELGDEIWAQSVRPLVGSMSTSRYRVRQHYEIKFRALDEDLIVGPGDGALSFSRDAYELQVSEIEFGRCFKKGPSHLWLGVLFDAVLGRDWYESPDDAFFCLREYTPLREPELLAICRAVGIDYQEGLPETKSGRVRSTEAARRLVEGLCRPRLTVDGRELIVDDISVAAAGIAVRFPVPRDVRLTNGFPRMRARLALPVAKTVKSFPAFVVEPTRGVKIVFDYGQSSIRRMRHEMFLTGERPFRSDHVRHEGDDRRLEVSTREDQWVFAGNGVVFLWEDEPAVTSVPAGAAASSHPLDVAMRGNSAPSGERAPAR